MSLPKSGSKDKFGKAGKVGVKSKFKPASAAAKADKEKDKDQIPGETPSSPGGHTPAVGN